MTITVLIAGGLVLGSFINMLVWRIPNGITLRGRSQCVQCAHTLAWFDLVPLASFALLRGRCRYCAHPILWRYVAVEAATAAGLVYVYVARPLLYAGTLNTIFTVIVVGVLVMLFTIDYLFQIVPDVITLPAIVCLAGIQLARGESAGSLALGALVAGGFFAAQFAFSKGRWIGDGDIRIGVLMGVILGWPEALVALMLAYVAGAAAGMILIGLDRARLTSKTPFGTYLSAATFVSLLYGAPLIEWYMHLWTRI